MPPDAFVQMTDTLRGGGAVRMLARGELLVDRVGRAAACLRGSGDADLEDMAAGFEAWLRSGGDLQKHLGLRVRRGGSSDLPHVSAGRAARDQKLRDLAEREVGADADVAAKVDALVALLLQPAGRCVIREACGDVPVPESPRQLRRILRGPA